MSFFSRLPKFCKVCTIATFWYCCFDRFWEWLTKQEDTSPANKDKALIKNVKATMSPDIVAEVPSKNNPKPDCGPSCDIKLPASAVAAKYDIASSKQLQDSITATVSTLQQPPIIAPPKAQDTKSKTNMNTTKASTSGIPTVADTVSKTGTTTDPVTRKQKSPNGTKNSKVVKAPNAPKSAEQHKKASPVIAPSIFQAATLTPLQDLFRPCPSDIKLSKLLTAQDKHISDLLFAQFKLGQLSTLNNRRVLATEMAAVNTILENMEQTRVMIDAVYRIEPQTGMWDYVIARRPRADQVYKAVQQLVEIGQEVLEQNDI